MNESGFGTLLRTFRANGGLSQEMLAERARLSPGAISALERGARRAPQHQTLALLAEALQLDPARRADLEEAAAAGRHRAPRGAGDTTEPLRRDNLPNVLTTYHGHASDLQELERLSHARRAITLLGPGGVGKTRLALQLAFRLVAANAFPGGIRRVELATITSADLVELALARVLNVAERPNEPLADTLIAAIADRRLLLILDNCEHLLAACAQIAETLLSSCSGIVLVSTTREALRIDGECVFRVRPLPVGESQTAGPAVDLFEQRLADADFERFATLSAADRAHAFTICQRLDGIPLALELAAARARELSLAAIVAGLDERFELLAQGRRSAEARQSTLRGMIDWSYDFLDAGERAVFARIGLFAAAFTPEAAAGVCDDDPVPVRAALAGLIAKSLVTVIEAPDGRLRYALLETMRAYALDRLREAGEYDRFAHRFALYFRARTAFADDQYGRMPNLALLELVEGDLENFRFALHWSLGERHDVQVGAQLACVLGWTSRKALLILEGERWVERAIAEAAILDEIVLGRLHIVHSFLVINLGDVQRALASAKAATAIYRRTSRASDLSWSLTQEAHCFYRLGQIDDARTASEEAAAIARACGDRFRLAGALNVLAFTIPIARARERFAPLEEAIRCCYPDFEAGAIIPMSGLAEAQYASGEFAAAFATGLRTVEIARADRDQTNLACALTNVAAYALTLPDLDAADRAGREALDLLHDQGRSFPLACTFQHLGSVATRRGAHERGARLLGAANEHFRHFGIGREFTEARLYDRTLGELHAAIGEERTRLAVDAGARMTLDEAIADARERTAKSASMRTA